MYRYAKEPESTMGIHKNKKFQRGFSLVEILVSISVIGILSATSIAAYNEYRISADRAVAAVVLKDLIRAWEAGPLNPYSEESRPNSIDQVYYYSTKTKIVSFIGEPSTELVQWPALAAMSTQERMQLFYPGLPEQYFTKQKRVGVVMISNRGFLLSTSSDNFFVIICADRSYFMQDTGNSSIAGRPYFSKTPVDSFLYSLAC